MDFEKTEKSKEIADEKCKGTEYAVEVNDKNGSFVRQLDIFSTYEEAVSFKENYSKPLNPGEYLNIIFINYDKNGEEIGIGSVM